MQRGDIVKVTGHAGNKKAQDIPELLTMPYQTGPHRTVPDPALPGLTISNRAA